MVQELGETVQAMMQKDDQAVQDILNKRSGHYWIVIHHKPTKQRLKSGEIVIMRLVKAYDIRPKNLLGTIILEVKDGRIIKEDVNLHDAPIDWRAITKVVGEDYNPLIQSNKDNAGAYLYNK